MELQGWKEVPVDCFILSLYHLQIFNCNKIKRGIVGLGEHTIASEHKNIEVQGLGNVIFLIPLSPDDIVKNTRTGMCIDSSRVLVTHLLEKQKKKKLIQVLEVRICPV